MSERPLKIKSWYEALDAGESKNIFDKVHTHGDIIQASCGSVVCVGQLMINLLPDQQSFQYSPQQPSQKSRSLMRSVNEENNFVSS